MENGKENWEKPSGQPVREVDKLTREVHSWWGSTFVFIKKTRVKTWLAVAIIAFIAGALTAVILTVSKNIQTSSRAAGEQASLSLVAATNSVIKDDTFNVAIKLNTQNNSIVVAKAVVNYNQQDFQLMDVDTLTGDFAVAQCTGTPSSLCAIINNDTANGKLTVTVPKPTPGISGSSVTVATLTFTALRPVTPSAANITLDYTSGSYSDSDVILNDTDGTDILSSVTDATVTVAGATCTSWTYSGWGPCQPDGTQSQTIVTSFPADCTGGNPVLTQDCTYTPPACIDFTYSNWSACQPDGTRSRTVTAYNPASCEGGAVPVLTETCTFTPPVCTDYNYSSWSACQPDSTQSRTALSGIPADCQGGASPVLSQTCTYNGGPQTCTDFNYSAWGACQVDNTQSRTVTSGIPANCTGGNPTLTQSCTFTPPTCTDFTYSDWGACQVTNTQTRTVSSSSPAGCTGGTPTLTQSCTYIIGDSGNNGNHGDKEKKDKKPKKRSISNSVSSVKRGAILTQRGSNFSKNGQVKLYFSKPGGGYYAPQIVKADSKGKFFVTYRVPANKKPGSYPWYAVDVKTGWKSKIVTYTVK